MPPKAPATNTDSEQHVYHHYDNDGARVNVSFEKNSKGYNFSATVVGATNVAEAMKMLLEADAALKKQFEPKEVQDVGQQQKITPA